jgi:hypothetical protein
MAELVGGERILDSLQDVVSEPRKHHLSIVIHWTGFITFEELFKRLD